MKPCQFIFQRYEKKYLLTARQMAEILKRMKMHVEQDDYGLHTICNIYYDTANYALIRSSIEKPVYKEKLRMRSYGVPTKESIVFLELKKKVNGVVYKRRIAMKYTQALCFLLNQGDSEDTQINREIKWFLHTYQPIAKTCIAYDRIAYIGKKDHDIRITFDTNIRWRDEQLSLIDGDQGSCLMEKEHVLMEIKIPFAMPIWLCTILNEMELYPVSYSKYGVCYKENLFPKNGGLLHVR